MKENKGVEGIKNERQDGVQGQAAILDGVTGKAYLRRCI